MSQAYPVIDHMYDVVVVGAGSAGIHATMGMAAGGPQDRLHLKSVPHAQPH